MLTVGFGVEQELSDIIGKSSTKIAEGTKPVNKAAVDRVSDLISEITSSAVEQASGLTEIDTGVNILAEVTQKNASMVETSAV